MDVFLTCDNLSPAFGGSIGACLDNPLCTWADVSRVLSSAAYNRIQPASADTLAQQFDPAFDADTMLTMLPNLFFFDGYYGELAISGVWWELKLWNLYDC